MSEVQESTPPPSSRAQRAAALRELRHRREQQAYDRRWREEERDYRREQSDRQYKLLFGFGCALLVILGLLAAAKLQREWVLWRVPVLTAAAPDVRTTPSASDTLPPPVLRVDPPRPGEAPPRPAEHGGLPTVPPEVFTTLIDKLFEGGTAAVSSTGELTKKFAEAGIRITEDAAKQILAALLRPRREPATAPGGPPAGQGTPAIGSLQVVVHCEAERVVRPTHPPPWVRKAPRQCVAPDTPAPGAPG